MTTNQQIQAYLQSLSEPKQSDMVTLHEIICEMMPGAQLWFLDGKDESGKVVSNPNIGYGSQTLTYADGSTKNFYQIGISGNSTGISVYIMGLKDKNYLKDNFGEVLGKASVTGYCIKFKKLKDIQINQHKLAIGYGIQQTEK